MESMRYWTTRNEIFALVASSGKPSPSDYFTETTDFLIKELPEMIPRAVEILNKGNLTWRCFMIEYRFRPSLIVLFQNGLKFNDRLIQQLIFKFWDSDLTILALKANPEAINESLSEFLVKRDDLWLTPTMKKRGWLAILNMCFKQGVVINENNVRRRFDFHYCFGKDVLEFLILFFNQKPSNERILDILMPQVCGFEMNELGYIFDHVSEDRKRDLVQGDCRERFQAIMNSRYLQYGIPGLDIIPDDMVHEIVSYLEEDYYPGFL